MFKSVKLKTLLQREKEGEGEANRQERGRGGGVVCWLVA